MDSPSPPHDASKSLRQEFRLSLQEFYGRLNLAPPYHSIEKAVQHLANTLQTKPPHFQELLLRDTTTKWELFEKIFSASGLSRKHRGILTNLAQNPPSLSPTPECFRFLKKFT